MCQGWHRRDVEDLRRKRLVLTEIRNAFRGAKDPWIHGRDILKLPGDEDAPSTVSDSPEDTAALWAELDERDAIIL